MAQVNELKPLTFSPYLMGTFNTFLPPSSPYPMNLQFSFLQGLLFEDVPTEERTG